MKRILSIVITAILAGAFAFTGVAPASASPRTGDLQITKECSEFSGLPGGFCTITSSNVKAINAGSKVIYAVAPAGGVLDTDIVLYTGPGNSAFGHVILHFDTMTGTVEFFGGTGQFRHFHAIAAVSALDAAGLNWAWEGDYSFSPDD